MGLTLHLNCLGEIIEGNYYRGYCLLSEDPEEPGGLFLVVYAEPDRTSEVLLSEWFPSIQAVNHFARDQNWSIEWLQ
ncbi:MAG TPA: hypothetical protein VFM78_02555 [Marinobacter sp.]|nr:hypothetical protein [Marinobacter sp.]